MVFQSLDHRATVSVFFFFFFFLRFDVQGTKVLRTPFYFEGREAIGHPEKMEGRISTTTPYRSVFTTPWICHFFAGNPFKPKSNKVQTLNPPSKKTKSFVPTPKNPKSHIHMGIFNEP